MNELVPLSQLDTSSPEALKRDLGRTLRAIQSDLRALLSRTLLRWRQRPGIVTPGAFRPALGFDELVVVDSQTGNMRVYLPRATSADTGRPVQFVKRFLANSVTIMPADGALVDMSASATVTAIGLHEVWWDGTHWWVK